MRKLTNTHPDFQAKIQRLATASNRTPEEVFEKWIEYSRNCDGADQSPVIGEFIEWYRPWLGGGDREELRAAIA